MPHVMEAGDGFFKAVAADEAHGVEGAAVAILPESIDGDNARMLEPTGDLGLEHEARPALRIVRPIELDFLERDLAIQLLVLGDENLAQAAFSMRPENAKARISDRGRIDG